MAENRHSAYIDRSNDPKARLLAVDAGREAAEQALRVGDVDAALAAIRDAQQLLTSAPPLPRSSRLEAVAAVVVAQAANAAVAVDDIDGAAALVGEGLATAPESSALRRAANIVALALGARGTVDDERRALRLVGLAKSAPTTGPHGRRSLRLAQAQEREGHDDAALAVLDGLAEFAELPEDIAVPASRLAIGIARKNEGRGDPTLAVTALELAAEFTDSAEHARLGLVERRSNALVAVAQSLTEEDPVAAVTRLLDVLAESPGHERATRVLERLVSQWALHPDEATAETTLILAAGRTPACDLARRRMAARLARAARAMETDDTTAALDGYRRARRLVDAEPAIEPPAGLSTRFTAALKRRAGASLAAGDEADAAMRANELLELTPDDARAVGLLRRALVRLIAADDDHEAVLNSLAPHIRADAGLARSRSRALAVHARNCLRIGDQDGAVQSLFAAHDVSGGDQDIEAQLVRLLTRQAALARRSGDAAREFAMLDHLDRLPQQDLSADDSGSQKSAARVTSASAEPAIGPEDPSADTPAGLTVLERGSAAVQRGDPVSAVAAAQEALRDPDAEDDASRLLEDAMAIGNDTPHSTEMAVGLRQLLDEHPAHPTGVRALTVLRAADGQRFAAAGDIDLAIVALRESCAVSASAGATEHTVALLDLARLLGERARRTTAAGRLEEAAEDLNEALDADAASISLSALIDYANAAVAAESEDIAIEILRRAVGSHPQVGDTLKTTLTAFADRLTSLGSDAEADALRAEASAL